jgi:hypothetical protein
MNIRYILISLSIIGFVAPAILELFLQAPNPSVDIEALRYLGLAVGFGMFVAAAWLEFHTIHNEFDKTKKSLEESIRSRRDFVNEGDAAAAMKKIKERFSRAIQISNVYMPYADRPNIYYHLTDDSRVANINQFLRRPGVQRYTEIISRDAYLERSEEYKAKIVDPFRRFDMRVTNRVFPSLNFIIFEYADPECEVLFGWGGYANQSTSKVYSTTEPDVVHMFQDIFATLSGVASIASSGDSLIGQLKTYLGYWVDVAITVDPKTNATQFTNAAVLLFYMDTERKTAEGESRLAVKGLAFGITDEGKLGELIREFSSTSCELRDKQIFVSHRSSDPRSGGCEKDSLGHSMYNFAQLSSTGYMYGTVFAPHPIINTNQNAISITARKLDPPVAAKIELLWGPEVQLPDLEGLRALVAPEAERLMRSLARPARKMASSLPPSPTD